MHKVGMFWIKRMIGKKTKRKRIEKEKREKVKEMEATDRQKDETGREKDHEKGNSRENEYQ